MVLLLKRLEAVHNKALGRKPPRTRTSRTSIGPQGRNRPSGLTRAGASTSRSRVATPSGRWPQRATRAALRQTRSVHSEVPRPTSTPIRRESYMKGGPRDRPLWRPRSGAPCGARGATRASRGRRAVLPVPRGSCASPKTTWGARRGQGGPEAIYNNLEGLDLRFHYLASDKVL